MALAGTCVKGSATAPSLATQHRKSCAARLAHVYQAATATELLPFEVTAVMVSRSYPHAGHGDRPTAPLGVCYLARNLLRQGLVDLVEDGVELLVRLALAMACHSEL